MYRLQTLDQAPLVLAVLPHVLQSATRCVSMAVTYLLLVSALCAWREPPLGKLRGLLLLEILVGLAIAFVGIGTFVLGDVVHRRHLPKLAFLDRSNKSAPHPPLPHPEHFRLT